MKISKFALVGLICVCCVCTGILASLTMSWFQPNQSMPALQTVRANTSDRVDGYLTCTGAVDAGLEAVYVLDSTTGLLSAGVLSKNSKSGGFQATYQGNVNVDLEKALMIMSKMGAAASNKKASRSSSAKRNKKKNAEELAENNATLLPSEPKYIMTAGIHDMPGQGAVTRPGASALYVTECNTGITLVYILPWNPSAHSSNVPVSSPITYYTFQRFLTPMVMEDAVDEE